MKQLILILSLLLFNLNSVKFCDNKETIISEKLTPFNIVLYSGDEAIGRYEIRVYEKEGKFYADNVSPYFYYGTKTDSIWTIELNQSKISTCKKFLKKAKSLPKECPERSSSIKDYTITFGKETIRIKGDCNWNNLDFFSLRELLFKEKFKDLELKKVALINELNKKVIGKWYFKPITTELKIGDYLILTKTNNYNSECYWDIGTEYSFKSSCNNVFDLTYSKEYQWHVDGEKYFQIQAGIITDKDGSSTVGNYDATFTLESLSENEFKLKFLWR